MIVFALIVLAAIVGGYVYFVRKVKQSAPVVPPVSVPPAVGVPVPPPATDVPKSPV